jgi:type IV secretion system protein VirB6
MDPMSGPSDPVAIQTNTASVAFNWHLFSGAYTAIDEPLTNAVDVALGNLIGYVNPTLKVLLTIYIIWIALQTRWVPTGAPVSGLIAHAARGAIIVMLLSNTSTFNQWVGTLFLHTIPDELGNALNGSIGAGAITGGDQFDDVWNGAWKAGLVVYKNLPEWSMKGAFLALAVIAFWGLSFIAVGVGFLMFLGAHVLMALLMITGPIFIACALFPASQRFLSGWLATTVGVLVTQVLVIALMSLMVRIEQNELAQVQLAPAGADIMGQVGSLIGVAGLLFICAGVAKQIPGIAVGIAGGAYHNLGAHFGAAASAVKSVVNGAYGVGRSAESSAASDIAPSSPAGFAGKSLSEGRS